MTFVSICIPTYNHGHFLGDALNSAMDQVHRDIEIVVLDNASTDNTKEIVEAALKSDSRIRYVRHSQNIGLIGNLNACIEHARGEYIKILCADDTLEPNCVAKMAQFLDRLPYVSLVGCARLITDIDFTALKKSAARKRFADLAGDTLTAECFFLGNRIGEPTAVLFRRADGMRGFSCEYHQLVDMEMWFHLLSKGHFVSLPEVLCKIRRHEGQATWDNDAKGEIVADRRRLFSQFGPLVASHASMAMKCLWDFRMAYALSRSSRAGAVFYDSTAMGVYFPRAFKSFTYPMVKLLNVFGLRRAWRAMLSHR